MTKKKKTVKAWALVNTGWFGSDLGIYPLTAYKRKESAEREYEMCDKISVVLFPITITYEI